MVVKPSLEGIMFLEVGGIHNQSSQVLAEDWMFHDVLKFLAAERVLEEESTRYQIRSSSCCEVFGNTADGL